uniref:Uncharacterized protein n=1 Tax=Physcomitrium patens TaxID=3218 RepID=A0A7I4B4Y5_PHYPA
MVSVAAISSFNQVYLLEFIQGGGLRQNFGLMARREAVLYPCRAAWQEQRLMQTGKAAQEASGEANEARSNGRDETQRCPRPTTPHVHTSWDPFFVVTRLGIAV